MMLRTTVERAILLLTVLGLATSVRAQESDAPANDADRGLAAVGEKDYAPYPAPDSGYVTDLADLLSGEQEERIEQWLWQTESRTGIEIAVVTIGSIREYPGTEAGSIEAFARGLFDAYGIGNMPENKGVLLLVAVHDRKARIEVGAGYGNLRDADARRIMDGRIIPHFKDGEYAEGITDGVRAIAGRFARVRFGTNWLLIALIVAVPVVILIAISLFRSGKRGWGWICVGLLIVILLAICRTVSTVVRHLPSGSSGSWSAGGFGGGFGGGFSGGGGATGSW
jgi:uncharacterized protein